MKKYIALFEYDENGGYGIVFPDLPGLASMGDDYDDAYRMAHEGLAFHLEGMAEDGYPIPKPRTFEQIKAEWGAVEQQANRPEIKGVHIAVGLSWYDALVLCNKLSMAEGLTPAYRIKNSTDPAKWGTVPTERNRTWDAAVIVAGSTGYRLPTEAQWEYAAKGGIMQDDYTYAGSDTVGDVAWYKDNSDNKIHNEGRKQPNSIGLYDMSGNVWEWCWDWGGPYSKEAQTDPVGPSAGDYRIKRGGHYNADKSFARSVHRGAIEPYIRDNYTGIRLVRP